MVTEVGCHIIGAFDNDFIKMTEVADLYLEGLPLTSCMVFSPHKFLQFLFLSP